MMHRGRSFFGLASCLLGIGIFLTAGVWAQEGEGGKKSKRATVDFTDQLVEGKADKPELFYLLQQKNANNKRLIRLRENFLPEMRRSGEDVGRVIRPRGGRN